MEKFIKEIICFFMGHTFRRTVSQDRNYDTWVCQRCGKVEKIAKSNRW